MAFTFGHYVITFGHNHHFWSLHPTSSLCSLPPRNERYLAAARVARGGFFMRAGRPGPASYYKCKTNWERTPQRSLSHYPKPTRNWEYSVCLCVCLWVKLWTESVTRLQKTWQRSEDPIRSRNRLTTAVTVRWSIVVGSKIWRSDWYVTERKGSKISFKRQRTVDMGYRWFICQYAK